MHHPIRRLCLFMGLLVGLFTVEMLSPVQAHVIQPFTGLIASVCAWLVQLFDAGVVSQGIVLRDAASGVAVAIQPGCNGVEAMITLTAAVVSFPATWRQRLVGLGAGFVAIQVLNVVRIISLFYLLQWNEALFEFAHLYLWQALIILDALVVFLIWLRRLPAPGSAVHA
ncbi:exosortase H [Arhodomonas sp. AD133]|uniref:exosortase H n=1 Tax=Arhodomonas sp. AD133 TaxID=3415009 RepID=UPI003EB8928D